MPFDERLASRVRGHLAKHPGVVQKRMFGGMAFLLNGNMCCGVHGSELIVRLDADRTEMALAQPHTRIFDLAKRPMRGWVPVGSAATVDDEMLAKWLGIALDYAARLPGK